MTTRCLQGDTSLRAARKQHGLSLLHMNIYTLIHDYADPVKLEVYIRTKGYLSMP